MFRLCGILLIFLTAAGSGILYNRALRGEHDLLCGLYALIEAIRQGIACYNLSLPEIYGSFSSPALDGIGFSDVLRREGFSSALSGSKELLKLDDALFDRLADFAAALGRTPSSDQIRRCDELLSRCRAELAASEKLLPGRTRSVTALSLGCGMMAVILLI